MAKITVVGSAMVVTSSAKLEDIKKVAKHRPEALTLKDAESKEVIFAICATNGKGDINAYGASFDGVSHDGEGKATITMEIPNDIEDAAKYAEDKIGVSIIKLGKVEEQITPALAEIDNELATVREHIDVI